MDIILTTPEQLQGIIFGAVQEAIKAMPPAKAESQTEKLLTRKETADKLKISLVTLNDWSKRGLLSSYLIGGRVLYKESEIEASLHQVKTVKY
jgi:hypothetical protein